ncbi:3-hydroxyacyl-ACP dehydratase FabZ [Desulfonema magnum]|uniref:3-hydroxyacyl-[acyl-carrier-protein] dehydratase FabZ n=1 Tax=Desulfonema magnum TaxID=45655 RepID=A0A975GK02_9BACT|nr:3-hydroxyacyl-ACP dehydratase FabZ [Desulfonema magnum]QTA84224.1 3-hydroxyacyl-[acyl-carrier-protein] dehydratase [Desulfonema magnum]
MEKKYDIQEIMSFLPHRYPFILVDRVLELVPKEKIVALKNVTINEPFFQGHFPGAPIMPGVLIVEAMAQTGAVLALESVSPESKGALFYFMGIDKAKFRKPVVPGDQLIFEVQLLKARAKAIKMSGVATVDGDRVAEAEFMATIGEKK